MPLSNSPRRYSAIKEGAGHNVNIQGSDIETICAVLDRNEEKNDVKNAGITHDVYENKGRSKIDPGITHDVYENKGT